MTNLDNPKTYEQLDVSGMRQHLRDFPKQCERAWQKAFTVELPPAYKELDSVIILGMGGSAIAGQLVRRLALLEGRIPVWVHQDYDLPHLVNDRTLVIASSYSGDTEETLSCFAQSLGTPAKKLVFTAGGKLRALADSEGIPCVTIDYKAVPRAALPHSFASILGVLQKLDILQYKPEDVKEALGTLSALSVMFGEETPLAQNPAKQLASSLVRRVPVIYGAGILSEVAQRWKTQINENSKTGAFYEVFPELSHNAVVGYEFPAVTRQRILTVLLHSHLFSPQISLRYDATAELLANLGIEHKRIEAWGKTPLAQMLSLVLFGDYVSLYLAMLNGVDPTPTHHIEYVKNHLSQLQGLPTSTSASTLHLGSTSDLPAQT